MKRRIAVVFAADVSGYSQLSAEDEEETLRRLTSYKLVMDDFIARAGGRVFKTDDHAILAEFSSAVEAMRCAIDVQESLRGRNMAYPPSRHMNYRIGITVGAAGQPGLGLKKINEQDAVDAAMADCGKQDTDCHVIVVVPFSVDPL